MCGKLYRGFESHSLRQHIKSNKTPQTGRPSGMANPDDLRLLDGGTLDLSGCDFTGADLSNRSLPGRDFSNSNLMRVEFRSSDLSNAKFSGALFVNINASSANCSSADFSGMLIQSPVFANANLKGATFYGTQIHNGDFRNANLKGTNFRKAALHSGMQFDGALVDEATSFDEARGPRELSRLPAFAGHTYEGGIFRRSVVRLEGSSMVVATGRATLTTAPQASGGTFSTGFSSGFQRDAFDEIAAEASAQRIVYNPRLFAELADQAAASIREKLQQLREQIPNEPEALDGYDQLRDALGDLEAGFLALAEQARSIERTESAPEKLSLAKTAVSAGRRICAGFMVWLDKNGPQAGRVIAELGLAGIITGTLAYFTGVSPTLVFSAAIAGLSGKSIWEVVKLFAPEKKDAPKS